MGVERSKALVTATHAVLFEDASSRSDADTTPALDVERACDACGDPLNAPSDDDGDGFAIQGSGVYVWARGDEMRRESAPLCAYCAAAIGMSALARWEIEEEEG
jgi:hypothetical protein